MRQWQGLSVIMGVFLALSACGGGGGGGTSTPPPAPPPSSGGGGSTAWQSGVFQSAATFKNRCAAPRSGVDIEGNAFPDMAGTSVTEKNWIRSWTRETYLWNTEVADRNPALGGTPVTYFGFMKTFAKTPSGRDKDEFHFSEPTTDYLARRNSEEVAGYGASFVIRQATVPRDVLVVFTDPDTPASEVTGGMAALKRGTRILSVDGIDVVYGISSDAEADVVNHALFTPEVNESHTFVVQDADSNTPRTVTLTAELVNSAAVNRTEVIDTATGKVGYIAFNTFSPFSSEREIAEAFQTVKDAGATDLVLDLRYNGGGLLAVAAQVGYMIAGDARTDGKTFELRRFNALAGNRNPVTGQTNTPVPFYSTGVGFTLANGAPLPTLNLQRVFILSTESTCSASEAVINGLQGIGVEVILVGGKTCGKPYGFYPQDNCGTTYYTIQFQGVNHLGFGDYAEGFVPSAAGSTETGVRVTGCVAQDDFDRELGDEQEALLQTALGYRTNGICPDPSLSVRDTAVRGGSVGAATIIFGPPSRALKAPRQSIMKTNRDMQMPHGY